MPKSRKKKAPKRTLALPDLEHAKSAVVNSLSSASGPWYSTILRGSAGLPLARRTGAHPEW